MWNHCEHEQLASRKSHYAYFEEAQLNATVFCPEVLTWLSAFLDVKLAIWSKFTELFFLMYFDSSIPLPKMKLRCREGVEYKRWRVKGVIERKRERGLCKWVWYWPKLDPSSNKNNHSLLLTNRTNQLGLVLRSTKSGSHVHVFLV